MLINVVHQKFKGRYRYGVVNEHEECKWHGDWQDNLILNQGMDQLYTELVCDNFLFARAGVGTRVTSIDSAGSTADQVGASLHLVGGGTFTDFSASTGGYTHGGDIGDMVKFSDTSEVRITAVASAITASVTPSQNVSGLTFVIWKTSQVGLQTEKSASSGYLTGTGNCGTTVNTSSGEVRHRRTFNFNTEPALVSYTEIGVSLSSTGASNVFSRILLPDPILIPSGSKLRVVYDLSVTYSPITPQLITASIGGWPVSPSTTTIATQSIQNDNCSKVNTAGTTINTSACSLDPSGRCSLFASTDSQSLNTFPTATSRTSFPDISATSKAAYVPLSFTCDKTGTFTETQMNTTHIRTIGFGDSNPNDWFSYQNGVQGFCVRFDQDQTKTNIQTMSFTFRWSWGRVLG